MRRAVRRVIGAAWRRARARVTDVYAVKAYSQEGEDMVLRRMFETQSTGFFVDVGAHHPRRFSNTYLFYKQGWRGINVEPNPDAHRLFRKERPRDVNVPVGVSDQPGQLTYYRFNEPALNSFDERLSRSRETGAYRIVGTLAVPVRRLDAILREHLPEGTTIDFLSVDVEGHDLNVLRSNDWQAFRPRCVVVEAVDARLSTVAASPIHAFLGARGYSLFAKTVHSLLYVDEGGRAASGGGA